MWYNLTIGVKKYFSLKHHCKQPHFLKDSIKYNIAYRLFGSLLLSMVNSFFLDGGEGKSSTILICFLFSFVFWEAHYQLLLFNYRKAVLTKLRIQVFIFVIFSLLYLCSMYYYLSFFSSTSNNVLKLIIFTLFTFTINVVHFLLLSLRQFDFQVYKELREKKIVMEERYKAIKSKTILHFLQNSLHATQKLITINPDKAIDQIETLTALLRSLLQSRDKDYISLKEESDLVREFIQLLELQGNVNIVCSVEDDPQYYNHQIPPFVLILIFDNIFLNRSFIPYAELQVYVENGIYLVAKYKQLRKIAMAQKQADLMTNLKQRYQFTKQEVNVVRIATQSHTYIKVPLLNPDK